MKVVEILEINNTRKKVVLEDGKTFVLYKGELGKLDIKAGEELCEESLQRIMQEILPRRAKLRGLNLLKSRPYTEHQMRQKYIDGGYPDEIINIAIDYLKGLHLINDYEYCRVYLTYKSTNKSRKRLVSDLIQKGVNKDTIFDAMNELEDNGDMAREEDLVRKILVKRNYGKDVASYEERQKIMSYLYGKGFSMDTIRSLT